MSNAGVAPGAGGVPGAPDAPLDVEMAAYDSLPPWMRLVLQKFPVKPNCALMASNYRRARAAGMADQAVARMMLDELRAFAPRLTRAAYGPTHPAA